ncbi:MAG: diguanylate cyclase [Desulfurobacteriaceae bacterium]
MSENLDLTKPIELGPEVFWVGYVVPNDPFQCHTYLIRNGEESILIDPGSMITFPIVLEKILKLVELKDIKYIIFHHQDPDITGCYNILEQLFPNPSKERFAVTHWRAKTLLKHYKWKTPFYLVDKHDWKLQAGDRLLEFVFTPYAHFPGAFCTYDPKSEILFSSDIFGAISDKFQLFATDDEEYYQGVELFHKHYMPSSAILNYALDKIMEKNPKLIAPQHGSIIKEDMIIPVVNRLRKLDCGLFLLQKGGEDIKILNKVDELLKRLIRNILSKSNIKTLLLEIFQVLKSEIPHLSKLVIVSDIPIDHKNFLLEVTDKKVELVFIPKDYELKNFSFRGILETETRRIGTLYLFSEKNLSREELKFLDLLYSHIKYPLSISLEKELTIEALTIKSKILEEHVFKDPLTGLHNRAYLKRCLESMDKDKPVSIIVIDIDHFKSINDTYGHQIGDCVLRELAKILRSNFREDDCVIRYGGEEFLVVLNNCDLETACKKAEKLRKEVEEHTFCKEEGLNLKVTISAGVRQVLNLENFKEEFDKADKALYRAKETGRNRVVCI